MHLSLTRASTLAALLASVLAVAAPARADDLLREWLTTMMEGAYGPIARRIGLTVQPGTPEWDAAIAASVDAVLAVRPPDCGSMRFGVNLCGVRPFLSPSGAMAPTLREREAVFVVPYSDGRRVERGDIVVFTVPPSEGLPSVQHIFRVVGLPGETIELRDGVVHINGTAMRQEPTGETWSDPYPTMPTPVARNPPILRETTPEGRSYRVTHLDTGYLNTAGPFSVPENAVLVLGDNRFNSADSRVPRSMGGSPFVPMNTIIGRAAIVYAAADRARVGTRLEPQ